MTRFERTGVRDLTFSRWHRTLRDDLHYMDLDYVGFCASCREVLFVAEICFDNGQHKPTTVTRLCADGLGVKGLLIRYRTGEDGEIAGFNVRQIAPQYAPPVDVAPETLAAWIERQHDEHVCGVRVAA